MSELITRPIAYWASGGWLLVPLAMVCFALWYYLLRTRALLAQALAEDHGMEEELLARLPAESVDSCRHRWARSSGLLASVLSQTLRDIVSGAPAADAFEASTSDPLHRLSRDFVIVAALTGAAPLLGLLGTVVGMIDTFGAVSAAAGDTAGHVASGISQALITTQFGLIIALPGMFGIARLHRLLGQVKTRFSVCKTHLLLGLGQKGVAQA